jgi:ComF family protein
MGKAQALRIALTQLATLSGDALVAAVLAPPCACCHRTLDAPLSGAVCARCWEDAHAASGRYEGALRDIIHVFKYEGRRTLTRPLAMLLRERNAAELEGAHCIVPVPLFAWRRLRRGFNQAAVLAAELDQPVLHALWRVRPTASQTGLSAAERRRNVHGAFRLSPLLSRQKRTRFIVDRVVVLLDDVMTTGATSDACAEVLMDAGAREVRVITLARAPLRSGGNSECLYRPKNAT